MKHTLPITNWHHTFTRNEAQEIIHHLESGKLIYFPNLSYELEDDEQALLHADIIQESAKKINYFHKNHTVDGIKDDSFAPALHKMLSRYRQKCLQLLNSLRPEYQLSEYAGGTTYRPAEIKGRVTSSYRNDDRLLHVDAFPRKPTNDRRILRVFNNINPYGESRHWQIGESYENVIKRFLPDIRPMLPLEAKLLLLFKKTDIKRWPYDHYMLNIHNHMKADKAYQAELYKTDIHFPPNSTWIVYSDVVSHAALSGRIMLEQTFNPPVHLMQNPALSTQKQMERFLCQKA